MDSKDAAIQVRQFLFKNSSTILTFLAVGGLVATTISAMTAMPKAMRLIEEEKDQREKDEIASGMQFKDPYGKIEMVKTTWKVFIPTILFGVVTTGCIIGSHTIDTRKTAAMASMYALAERALHEYQSKVVETLGEKKEEKIREEIIQDKMNSDPVSKKDIIITGKGDVLCYDTLSGRYFLSDINYINKVMNNFNHKLMSEMSLPLNDFYYELGLEPTELGRILFWVIESGLNEVYFTTKITDDGRPCLVLSYKYNPVK